MMYHSEKLPSAIERYVKEITRVTGVLEGHLAQQKVAAGSDDGPWLVGNKFSYADFAFIPWQVGMAKVLGKDDFNPDDFPHVQQWLGNMTSREGVKAGLESMKRPE